MRQLGLIDVLHPDQLSHGHSQNGWLAIWVRHLQAQRVDFGGLSRIPDLLAELCALHPALRAGRSSCGRLKIASCHHQNFTDRTSALRARQSRDGPHQSTLTIARHVLAAHPDLVATLQPSRGSRVTSLAERCDYIKLPSRLTPDTAAKTDEEQEAAKNASERSRSDSEARPWRCHRNWCWWTMSR